MKQIYAISSVAAGGIAIFIAFTLPFLLSSGPRETGVLENIHGIPYPAGADGILVSEDMAHADVYLQESVLAKQATFTIAFDPKETDSIDVGVRENAFWLSYEKQPLYRKSVDPSGPQTKVITVPLTRMIQESNKSIDVMFFATSKSKPVQWSLQEFYATVDSVVPSAAEIRSFGKSILIRERPL